MSSFKDCVCISQARIISGRQKGTHICTIAFQPAEQKFLRLCVPYSRDRLPVLKRWSVFDFDGTKEGLKNDTRDETWNAERVRPTHSLKDDSQAKRSIHASILSNYKYESELNSDRLSIGLLIPQKNSLKFYRENYSPSTKEDQKQLERGKYMADLGIWFPPYKVFVKGKRRCEGRVRAFTKQLLAWDVYEALRKNEVDPFAQIYDYTNPYMILGNLATQRRAFMVIGVLSAPPGYIEKYAIHQQLSLTHGRL